MSRRLAFIGLWVFATVAIGFVARAAVGLADRAVFPEGQAIRVIDIAPPATSGAAVATTTTAPPATTSAPSTSSVPATTTTTSVTPPSSTVTTTIIIVTTTLPSSSQTTLTTVPPTTTTSVVPSTTTTTEPPAVQTLVVVGGAVTVEAVAGTIAVIDVTVNQGFEFEVTRSGPDRIEVLFRPEQGVGTSFVRCVALPVGSSCETS